MDTKGISMRRLIEEIEKRKYPVPELPVLKENLMHLEPQLRFSLDDRFDAHGNILAGYETIAKKEGISAERIRERIEKIFWILAGKPEAKAVSDSGFEEYARK